MGRIQKAYETRFGVLLRALSARRTEQGVAWLVAKARRLGGSTDFARALSQAAARLEQQVKFYARIRSGRTRDPTGMATQDPAHGDRLPQFLCDAGLGGLARWLRAAGYVADWQAHIADEDLLRLAKASRAIVVTTDSLLLERRLVRDGQIQTFWLPPALGIGEQLALVLQHFDLALREPRCMHCGGELRSVPKEAVWERIPPRTRRWLDDYFECVRCARLYWHGTHWQRIKERLGHLRPGAGRVG
jgi:hypothetical protein